MFIWVVLIAVVAVLGLIGAIDQRARRNGRSLRGSGDIRGSVLEGKRDARVSQHQINDAKWTSNSRPQGNTPKKP